MKRGGLGPLSARTVLCRSHNAMYLRVAGVVTRTESSPVSVSRLERRILRTIRGAPPRHPSAGPLHFSRRVDFVCRRAGKRSARDALMPDASSPLPAHLANSVPFGVSGSCKTCRGIHLANYKACIGNYLARLIFDCFPLHSG